MANRIKKAGVQEEAPEYGSKSNSASPKSSFVTVLKDKKVLEFFAGIGLVGLGLEPHGWQMAWANDIDPVKFELFKRHFPDEVEKYSVEDVHWFAEHVDLIPSAALATASFPCNDLSLAGGRKGLAGQHSSAFWGFIEVLKRMGDRKPSLVMLENVVGFLSSHGGKDFETALLALNELGFSVDAIIVDAVRFVPQSRQRLFVIGTKASDNLIVQDPQLDFIESDVRPKKLAEFILAHPHISWSVRKLPQLPNLKPKLTDIVENLPDDADEWWSSERAGYLLNQMSERHRALAQEMMSLKKWSYGTVFRRMRYGRSMAEMRTDGIAGCLRTPRGGSGRQILFKAGFGRYKARLITPREAARLMGADDFRVSENINQALFGFGDAVCVPVISWIAENYLSPAADELAGSHRRALVA